MQALTSVCSGVTGLSLIQYHEWTTSIGLTGGLQWTTELIVRRQRS